MDVFLNNVKKDAESLYFPAERDYEYLDQDAEPKLFLSIFAADL